MSILSSAVALPVHLRISTKLMLIERRNKLLSKQTSGRHDVCTVSYLGFYRSLLLGVGYMVGPAMGGWLFVLGRGPRLPLLVNAVVVGCLIPLVGIVVRRFIPREDVPVQSDNNNGDDDDNNNNNNNTNITQVNVRRIASRPLFLAVAMVLLTLSVSFGVFPPTLTPHLQRTLHISEGGVGSVYAVVAVRKEGKATYRCFYIQYVVSQGKKTLPGFWENGVQFAFSAGGSPGYREGGGFGKNYHHPSIH